MSLAIRGNTFLNFFGANKAILGLVDRKWTQKSTLLAKLTPVIWPFWGSKNHLKKFFSSVFDFFSIFIF